MDPLITVFLKHGVLGILAGVGFYLFFMERRETKRLSAAREKDTKTYLEAMIADTAAKTKLLGSVNDLTETVDAFWKQANTVWTRTAEERAEARGRQQEREVTGRFFVHHAGDPNASK